MLACLSGTAILIYIVHQYKLISTSTFMIACSLISLLVAFGFYGKMILANRVKVESKPEPLPLQDD